MRRTTALAIVSVLVMTIVGIPATPAAAGHCRPLAFVERNNDGAFGYHNVACSSKVDRIRLRYEGINCESKDLEDCFAPGTPYASGHVVYNGWKDCFNTDFCRYRRKLASAGVPESYYCARTWGEVYFNNDRNMERLGSAWDCKRYG